VQLLTSHSDISGISSNVQAPASSDVVDLHDLVLEHVLSCDVCMSSVVDLSAPSTDATDHCPQLREMLAREKLGKPVEETGLIRCLADIAHSNCL
jgi:hypothetical protein